MQPRTITWHIPPHRLCSHMWLRPTASALAAGPLSFAYIANHGDDDVSIYALEPATGHLSLLGTVQAGTGPRSITVHPSGRFAYVTNDASFDVTTYSIDAAGMLSQQGISYVILEPARSMAIHPAGRSAYIPWYQQVHAPTVLLQTSGLRRYGIDRSGSFTLVADITPDFTHLPRAVAVDPSGRFVYVVNGDEASPEYNAVSVFSTDDLTGQVTNVLGSVSTGATPQSMTVDPSGRFAYVVNAGSNDVSMYAIEPTGRFVYVANHGSHDVSLYTIESTTGLLLPLPQGTVAADTHPWWITVDPSGQFAYVANHRVNTISMYRIDTATGQLTPFETLPTRSGPAAVVAVTLHALWLSLNATDFQPGSTLILSALITPWPTLGRVDFYVALQLPDGTVVFVQDDDTFTAEPRPFIADWDVVSYNGELLRLTFGDTTAVGQYRWLAGFTEPGAETFIDRIAEARFRFSDTA